MPTPDDSPRAAGTTGSQDTGAAPDSTSTRTDTAAADTDTDAEFVDPADLTVTRDGDGQLIPEIVDVGSLGKAKILPMPYGDAQKRLGDGTEFDMSATEMAEIFDNHIVEPNLAAAARQEGFDGLTANYVNDMLPLIPTTLLDAIFEASGVEADVEMDETDDGDQEAQVSVTNPGN